MNLVPGYRFRLQVVPTLLCLGAVYFFSSLGMWQVRRLRESEARQEEFLQHIAEPPIDVAAAADDIADRRVAITGIPHWDRRMLVAGKYMFGQPGYQVILPVESTASSVLVNIGWVPQDEAELVLKNEQALPGERRFSGLARAYKEPVERRWSFPLEDGYQRTWGEISPLAMAANAGVKARPWMLIEGEAVMGDDEVVDRTPPISGWRARLEAPPHRNYAITWFSLTALVVVLGITISFQKVPREAGDGGGVAGGSNSRL